ncbi:glycosyltransferase family 4 protein [Psychrobacter sp. T6-5]|uniref:glycosyltransferase family 4 protein n=1 Tax=Psychrobacter sp. T6-5 TaxID=3457451 RepID=UPI003FD58EC2
MKIAKVLVGNPSNRKGFFNNVIERTKHLMAIESEVDCYMIRIDYGIVMRILKRQFGKSVLDEFYTIDGITFKNLWIKMGALDYLLTHRLHRNIVLSEKQLENYLPIFEQYDLLSSHGIEASYLSKLVKNRYSIPFITTWHGSDINITPSKSTKSKQKIKQLLESANHNFFVSKKLLETASTISIKAKKSVLYTGPSSAFYRYDDARRIEIIEKYSINTSHVVGFIGNFVSIKNVLLLPEIFLKLQNSLDDISFVIVGNGELERKLKEKLAKSKIKNLHMLGKQEPENVAEIMNMLDVLILPSLNEGLPRVTLEAQACGVHVVGSNRGGIPEAIGSSNCFELDENFIDAISARILILLKNKSLAKLSNGFSWPNAIRHEREVHQNVCTK